MDERKELVTLGSAIVYVLILAAATGGLLAIPGGGGGHCTPTIDFAYSSTGLALLVTDRTVCPVGTYPATYAWNWGDGSPGGSGYSATHNYSSGGTYVVTHTSNQAPGTASRSVSISAPGGPVTASFTSEVVLGTTNIVQFSGSAGGGTPPYTFAWAFGDGVTSTEQSPRHGYQSPGTYAVTLTVTDSKGASATATRAQTVTTGVSFTPAFTYTTSGLTVRVSGSCSECTSSTPTYAWSFGDGTNSAGKTATHTYAASGSYTITLTLTDSGITEQVSHSVSVSPPLYASFTWTAQYLAASFVGSASGGTGTYSIWSWNFGDNSGSSAQSPSHTYSANGAYEVALTVTDNAGNTNTVSRPVTVSSNTTSGPLAASFTTATDGLLALFTSTATGGTAPYTYTWAFGDSGVSSQANPTHTYAAAGNYSVTLTVTDTNGVMKTAVGSVQVSPTPPPPGPPPGPQPSPLEISSVFLVIGLAALAIAIVTGLGETSLEDREKWIYGAAIFAVGALLLVVVGLASPFIPRFF